MTTRHRHPDGARAPQPPRNWTVPVIAAGAVVVTVAAGASIAFNDNLGDPMTFAQPRPTRTEAPRTTAWQTPQPVFPSDIGAPAYPFGTETAVETSEPPQIATSSPVSVPAPSTHHLDAPASTEAARADSAGSEAELTTAPEPGTTDHHLRIVADTNAARAELGCGPLTVTPDLDSQAQAHAQAMADARDMFHSDGPEGYDRWAENVAQGFASDEVVDGWMASPGHRANLQDCSYTQLGVGYVDAPDGPYAVQMLAA